MEILIDRIRPRSLTWRVRYLLLVPLFTTLPPVEFGPHPYAACMHPPQLQIKLLGNKLSFDLQEGRQPVRVTLTLTLNPYPRTSFLQRNYSRSRF